MALPDRDSDLLLLMLLMLVAERNGSELADLEPFFEETLRRLERDSERQDSPSSYPTGYMFHLLRRSIFEDGVFGRRSRLKYKIDQIYSHSEGRFDQLGSEIDRRFAEINDKIEAMGEKIEGISLENGNILENATKSIEKVSDALKTLEWALSLGVSPADVKAERSIPIRIYLTEKALPDVTSSIVNSIIAVLENLSFEKDIELPEESGSWWKRLWMKTKEVATQEEMQERLIKIERIAETRFLEKPQAEANKDHAAAVATIMKSLENVNSACIQIGNILLVKHTVNGARGTKTMKSANVMVRTLNAVEMRALEKNQTLLKDPSRIIQKIEHFCATSTDPLTKQEL